MTISKWSSLALARSGSGEAWRCDMTREDGTAEERIVITSADALIGV